MAANGLHWIPDSLYNSAISAVVTNYTYFQKDLGSFPDNVLFDICYKLYKQGHLCQLGFEFCHLSVFIRVLKVKDKRHLLHHCFQALMDHGARSSSLLANAFKQHCNIIQRSSVQAKAIQLAIQCGFSLGGFLCDAGWFPDSEVVFLACFKLCKEMEGAPNWVLTLECCLRLLHVRTVYCKFQEAEETFREAQRCIEHLRDRPSVNLAAIYGEFVVFFFCMGKYAEAYNWSVRALKELTNNLSPRVILDVLRPAAKACVIKREFKRAELLIKQAFHIAREHFGLKHPKTAETCLDYGFYLLNVDSIAQSVKIYQKALDIRQNIFGGTNLYVASAHEDLAYACYVHEYSSGKFQKAKEHADKALKIMTQLLPEDHLLLASSKRVKALILEEIAIDNHDKSTEVELLRKAQELHLTALRFAQQAFGEKNVQTAKHYGNLGRLYQSMQRFAEAEQMHLKAIQIKEELLGPEDYEVALSVGHLASLYNYDLNHFDKAEKLYLRSIEIGKNLFGESYSGLEYDYRGLLRVYMVQGNGEKTVEYTETLRCWKQLRERNAKEGVQPFHVPPLPPADIFPAFIQIN